jgi:hypothetical protein
MIKKKKVFQVENHVDMWEREIFIEEPVNDFTLLIKLFSLHFILTILHLALPTQKGMLNKVPIKLMCGVKAPG